MARKQTAPRKVVKPVQKPNNHGGWVPKVTRSTILVCGSCKTRYIKTRPVQSTCIKCLYIPIPRSVSRIKKVG